MPTYQQYAYEKPTEDTLVVCESDRSDCISNIRNIRNAGYFEFQTILKDPTPIEVKNVSFQELQSYCGSKIAKKALKTTGQFETQLNIDQIKLSHNIPEEQILPKFNETAMDIKKIYAYSTMFDSYLIQRISEYFLTVKNIKTPNFQYTHKHKIGFIVLDTILYVLKKKYIPDRLPHDEISYDILSQVLSQNTNGKVLEYNRIKNINNLERMKLIAMCYVIILKINDLKVNLIEVPKFNLADTEVEQIFKVLGCKIENGTALLKRVPDISTHVRRRRR